MIKYKVLQVLGSPTEPTIRATDLEEKINQEAEEGWKVLTCTPSNITFKGNEIERLLIILEKE